MTSTALQPAAAHDKGWGDRMAKGHTWEKDNSTWRAFAPQNCPEGQGQGAGSIISSANDLIKRVKALLYHEGPINDRIYRGLTRMRSIVNPNARRLKPNTTPANYTAGMEVYFYRGNMVVGHDGNIPGFASRFMLMPECKFGAVVLGNSAGASAAATVIIRTLMDEVLGVPIEERPTQSKPKENTRERDLTIHPKTGHQDKKKSQKEKKNLQPQGQRKEKEPIRDTRAPQAQETPLDLYTGRYWNAGYHTMTVQIKDDQLFIDTTDRSMGFTMTFEHVKDQTEYIAHLKDDVESTDEPVNGTFHCASMKNKFLY